jgi:hypothetical protein
VSWTAPAARLGAGRGARLGGRDADERAEHQRRRAPSSAALAHRATLALLVAGALSACHQPIDAVDGGFYPWDARLVHCGISVDSSTANSDASILGGLDRARDRGEVLELYGHGPGVTIPLARIEAVLAAARDRGLAFYTYEELAHGVAAPTGGLALGFDDNAVEAWMSARELFSRYGAHVTFFVSRYATITDAERAMIHQLAGDGHAIEAHTVHHPDGPAYVERYGLDAYLTDEVLPSIDRLRADGYPVAAFAYPFGARTTETDAAILPHVAILRSTASAWGDPIIQHGCPR